MNSQPSDAVAMVVAENVSKRVISPAGELTILAAVSLSVASGESAAIVGASGSGKSTLLALLAGLDRPSDGQISIAGHRFDQMDENTRASIRGELIGVVFQQFHLLPNLTAVENVALPLEIKGEVRALPLAQDLLREVGLQDRARHYPHQLSGGEQQRVAIARAFVARPRLLLADEPTGNLDQSTGDRIINLLFNLNQVHHTTLMLVTHDSALASRCRRCFELDHGHLRERL